jgi:hypothetical protein
MADKFRREMDVICDVGGAKCDCCNPYKGKTKKILNRLVRRRLKHAFDVKLKREFNN